MHPTLIPEKHVLASVNGVFNALAVHGDIVGDTLFYGRGAGQDPTSSAVIADLAEAADALQSPRQQSTASCRTASTAPASRSTQIVSEYYLRLTVEDRPGVIAQIAGILGELNIGISSIFQPEARGRAKPCRSCSMIHKATQRPDDGRPANRSPRSACVKKAPRMIRVENFRMIASVRSTTAASSPAGASICPSPTPRPSSR